MRIASRREFKRNGTESRDKQTTPPDGRDADFPEVGKEF